MPGSLFRVILFFLNAKSKYDEIASDESRRKSSVYFGVRAIINSVIFGVIAAASMFGLSYFIEFMSESFIIGIVMVIVFAALALVSVAYFVFGGLMYIVYQLKLNDTL